MASSNPIRSLFLGDRRAGWVRFILLVLIPGIVLAKELYEWLKLEGAFLLGGLILVYFFGLTSAFASATYYLKDIYEEPSDQLPFRYLKASFFGLGIPKIQINARKERSKVDRMVEVMGGPAYLEVDPGWVVLSETLTAPANLYSHGKRHFMPRHERIHDLIDLHEQEAVAPQIAATTRDGIKVFVDDVKFNYRIFDPRWGQREHDTPNVARNPYPISKIAVHDYSYKRPVAFNPDKKVYEQMGWKNSVSGKVVGIIREFINAHKLDEIIAPRDQKNMYVRDTIRKKAYENSFIEGMKSIGTVLRWWDPGEFHSQEDVEKQYVANWSTDIQSDIKLNHAHGEAQKMAYEELGRAEAEAELLVSIIHALEGIRLGKDKVQTLQNLILLRTAQVIKALGYNPPSNEKK